VIIEVWSDIACPFCYLGKRQLISTINKVPYSKEITIVWKSFELNPEIENIENQTVNDYLEETRGMSKEQIEVMQNRIIEQAQGLGIEFNFHKTKMYNTRKAHALLHIAQKSNLGNQVKEELFRHHFTLGSNLTDDTILHGIAEAFELDTSPWGDDPFNHQDITDEITLDQYQAQQVGARGVPFFIFDGQYSLSGAHGENVIYKVMDTVKMKSSSAL
jgi:predicted DsbA family dithiol-disulfide isomerase